MIDVLFGAIAVLVATSAGALLVLFFKKIGKTEYSVMLAFSAGMMAFSSLEMLAQSHERGQDIAVLAGFLAGLGALYLSDRLLPHIHKHAFGSDIGDSEKKAVLIVGTIALHNIPEGFAIAAAFADSSLLGWIVTTSMAIQDFPEGALVSTPLACYGVGQKKSVGYGMLSGVIEAGAALLGYMFLSAAAGFVPLALSFSAGAMAYVIFVELLPDASENRMERIAALSFAAGAAAAFIIGSFFS